MISGLKHQILPFTPTIWIFFSFERNSNHNFLWNLATLRTLRIILLIVQLKIYAEFKHRVELVCQWFRCNWEIALNAHTHESPNCNCLKVGVMCSKFLWWVGKRGSVEDETLDMACSMRKFLWDEKEAFYHLKRGNLYFKKFERCCQH